jgi:D-alanyl-D-alanine carboxypeptidase
MMPRQTLSRTIISLMGALVMLAGFVVLSAVVPERSAAQPEQFPPTFTLPDSALSAKAAIVYDPTEHRIIFAKNAAQSLPLASLTKLMAAQALLAEHPENTRVTITPDVLKVDGSITDLRVGEEWSLHDLLLLGLVASSNQAMAAAAGSSGDIVGAMNRLASRLGLTQTYFLNPTGLDLNAEISGAYGSAHDVAILAANFLKDHPEFFEASTRSSITVSAPGRILHATSTATPLEGTLGLIGAKTGYTDLAGGNLVTAFDIAVGHPLIAVVLGSTRDGRFQDIETLISAARAAAHTP